MRLLGITIPNDKKIKVSLTYIYGIGISLSEKILKGAGVDVEKMTKDVTQDESNNIKNLINKDYKIEEDLRRDIKQNITRLKEIKSYRGDRHIKNLPVRGQRTKTNSRTVHGNKHKTVGSGRRKASLK